MQYTTRRDLRNVAVLAAAVCGAAGLPGSVRAAEPDAPPGADRDAVQAFREDAARYAMRAGGERLELRPAPALHWGNPERNRENGAMFVWLRDGRPEVIGSIFTYEHRDRLRLKHELTSLSPDPVRAEYKGDLTWAPQKAGVVMTPLPDVPPPAEAARLRLLQMRALAREFSASMTDREGRTTELRLMPQPLLRYEPMGTDVMDGALFALVVGTDPEVLLLIEARLRDGKPQWHYGAARSHHVTLELRRRDAPVWRAEPLFGLITSKLGQTEFQAEPYISYHVTPDEPPGS